MCLNIDYMEVMFLFLFVKRLLSNLNIMSLVAVKKRKSGKNRKDRNKVDRKVRRKENFQSAFSALHWAVDQSGSFQFSSPR